MIATSSTIRVTTIFALTAGLHLLLPAAAHADTRAASAAPASVTVSGNRALHDPAEFLAANSRILGRTFASSCNFMSGYNPYDDDIFIDYITGFGGITSELRTIRDIAPFGDAARGVTLTSSFDMAGNYIQGSMDPAVKCASADRRFAAGRHRIARNDKTFTLALNAYESANYPEAQTQFKANYRKLANPQSALMLSRMYLQGQGVPADTTEAIAWLHKVVDQRFSVDGRMRFDPAHPELMSVRAEAAMTLAKIYMVGHGVPRDLRKARGYYEMASDAGYIPATAMLGTAYLSGFAGDKNIDKGIKYLKEAAEAGYPAALYQLGKVYYNGDGVAKDWTLAGAYFTTGAQAGHPGAQLAAARMYDFGESVASDPKRALTYYKEAAVKGVPAAQNALATYFYKGEVVDQNLITARQLFNTAAMQAQPDAMYNLAVMSRNGEGGARDLSMAYVWFSLAKQARYPDAELALADVTPQLSQAELARADAILKPAGGTSTR